MNEQFEKWFKEETTFEYVTPQERAWAFSGWKASIESLWHPIEEPAPVNTLVELCVDKEIYHDCKYDSNTKQWCEWNNDFDRWEPIKHQNKITHWMIPMLPI